MRPITVTVGPLAATGNLVGGAPAQGPGYINLGQTPPGAANTTSWSGVGSITNGVLSITSTTSGAFAAGGRLTGAGVAVGTVVLGPAPGGGWRVSPPQTLPSTGLRLNQVITLDAPRQIVVTNTEAAGNSITVNGTDAAGNLISETMATNGAALTTSQSFATVTSISVAAPTLAAMSVVTAATATSALVAFDPWANAASITKQATLTGAATFSVQISNDDPNAPGGPLPGGMTWSNDPDATFVGATTPVEGSWAFVPLYARVLLTAGAGAVRMTFSQQGSP